MTRFALAATAALLLTSPAAAAVNFVSNGSFENGLTGWTIGGVDTDPRRVGGYPPAAITYNSATPYPTGAFSEAVPVNNAPTISPDPVGTHAAYFVSDFTVNQSLNQSVFLTPGNYEIGFSAYAPANGYSNTGEAFFAGSIGGVSLASYAVSTGPETTWQSFTGLLTITSAGNYGVHFLFNTDLYPSKDVVIDQVYIVRSTRGGPTIPGVPEASTWAMLIAGFGLVGVAVRRRAHAALA